MADSIAQIDTIVDVLGRLGIAVRKEHLGGLGGGLCSVRGERVLFLDIDADTATQLDQCVTALADIPETDGVYLIPAVREQVERLRDLRSR